MSAPSGSTATSPARSPGTGPSPTGISRHRRTVLVVLGALLILIVVSVLSRDKASFGGDLDPRNPKASGAQALARVVASHGVEVTVVRGQAALLAQRVNAHTAVVVTNPLELGPSTLTRLQRFAEPAGALVVVGGAAALGPAFAMDPARLPAGRHPAACSEDLVRGLVVRTHGGSALREPGCFGADGASALVRRQRLWLLTSPASLSNRHVLESDNAALGVRLLGQQDRLLWYVADSADLSPSEGVGLARLLPAWLGPSAILLVLAVLALMLWRGRRLGPLVREPLPVVVRAAESTHSRGRLYRRTADRGHAASILVEATRRRLGTVLGLAPNSPPSAIISATAARTGRDPNELHDLLTTTTVPSNALLADLGRRLQELENEVRVR